MEENEYIEKWIDCRVTLSEWLSNRNIDHWEIITQCNLSEEVIEEIETHQFSLFNESIKNNIEFRFNRLLDKPINIRKNIIQEQLRLMNLFIQSTKVEIVLIELLNNIISIKEEDYTKILVSYQNVIAETYMNFRDDFNVCQKGRSLKSHYYSATFIFKYKQLIESHLLKINGTTKIIDNSKNISNVLTLENLFLKQNNLTTKISIKEVYDYFKILTEMTNKNNQFYLTPEQLIVFINTTFSELKPIKQNFNCDTFIKKDIRKIFYDFYNKYKNRETNETLIKRKYFKIMNESFNGFNENDYTDFAK